MIRRVLAVLAVALGVAVAVAPASAQSGYSGGWTDPAPSGTYEDKPLAYLEAATPLSGTVSHPNGISRVTAVLDPSSTSDAPKECEPSMDELTAEQSGNQVTFHVPFTFPCNLRYQVRATAYARASGGLTSSTPDPFPMPMYVAVAIPPAPVSEVEAKLVVDGDDRTVTLEWPSNDEPDLLGYVVQRTSGGETETLGQVAVGRPTKFEDGDPPAGQTARYSVIAVRSGPDDEVEQVSSEPTSVRVEVPAKEAAAGGSAGGSPLTTVVTGQPSQGQPDPSVLSSVNARNGNGVRPGPPTTLDTGFQETLPFQPSDELASAAPPVGDAAVVLFDEGGGSGSPFDDKTTMSLVAGGLAVLVGASVILLITRRAARAAY